MATEVHRPSDLEQAVALLAQHPGARALAGGTTLVQQVHRGLRLAHVVSLEGVDALWGVAELEHTLRIGAATPMAVVLKHAATPPLLVAALQGVGSPQSRNRATVGGDVVCQGELTTALMALDARVHIRSAQDTRVAPVEEPGLNPMELVTHIEVPVHGDAWLYRRVSTRQALAPADLLVAASASLHQGRVAQARVAVGGHGVLSFRSPMVEASLVGMAPDGQRAALLHNDVQWPDRLAGWRLRAAKNVLRAWLDSLG